MLDLVFIILHHFYKTLFFDKLILALPRYIIIINLPISFKFNIIEY